MGHTPRVRRILLVVGVALLALGGFAAVSSPTPEGYDADVHGASTCSSATLEVFGFGSEDTNAAGSPGGDGLSIGIDDCKGPARRQSAVAVAVIAVAVAVLVIRRRMEIPPASPIGG
jgi:hypothetical protein